MQTNTRRRASLWGLAILMGVALTMSSTTRTWADTGGHGHHKRPDASRFIWHVLKAKDVLNLSDEQQARLQTLAVSFKKENVKKTAEVDLAEIDMHQLLHSDGKQAGGDLESAVKKMYALKADRRLALIKAFQEARGVLTPEQQNKLRELRTERHGMDERHAAMDRSGGGHDRLDRHDETR
jgi:Spy/CpxP family protein refolding chaperone